MPGLRVWHVEQPGSRTGTGGRFRGLLVKHMLTERADWPWASTGESWRHVCQHPLPHTATAPRLWHRHTGTLQAWMLQQPLYSQDCVVLRLRAQYCSSLPLPFRTSTCHLTARPEKEQGVTAALSGNVLFLSHKRCMPANFGAVWSNLGQRLCGWWGPCSHSEALGRCLSSGSQARQPSDLLFLPQTHSLYCLVEKVLFHV